jgi:hypothetical protein
LRPKNLKNKTAHATTAITSGFGRHIRMVRVFKIAVCGAGVVGGGVINLIKRQHALFRASRFDFEVKTVSGLASFLEAANALPPPSTLRPLP